MTESGRKKLIKLHAIMAAIYCLTFLCGLIVIILSFTVENESNIWPISLIIILIVFLSSQIILAFFHRRAKVFLENGDSRGKKISVFLAIFLAFGFPIGTLGSVMIFTLLKENDDKLKKLSNYSPFKKWLTFIINIFGWFLFWAVYYKSLPVFQDFFWSLGISIPKFYIKFIEYLFIINTHISFYIAISNNYFHIYFYKISLALSIFMFIFMLFLILFSVYLPVYVAQKI